MKTKIYLTLVRFFALKLHQSLLKEGEVRVGVKIIGKDQPRVIISGMSFGPRYEIEQMRKLGIGEW